MDFFIAPILIRNSTTSIIPGNKPAAPLHNGNVLTDPDIYSRNSAHALGFFPDVVAASFVFVSNSSLLLSILTAVLYILFLRSHSAIPQINSILLHKIHSSSFLLSLELFLITGSIIIFLFQKSNKLSKNFIFRSIVTIFFLKINNNTSSLETFEDQNDYLLG